MYYSAFCRNKLPTIVLFIIYGQISFADNVSSANFACSQLSGIGTLMTAFPNSTQYNDDISHWALSSQQIATCTVEPSSPEDVSTILKVVGKTKSLFAVKSGGHAYNPGFSSTTGVQISMARFNSVTYDATSSTATIGVGLTWDQVYAELQAFNVTVAGGRIPGIGVGGLTLGGGYSWMTDEHGLTIDTIIYFNLVLPSGQIVLVDNETQPELFFGLKGGLNNFGIVTSITMQAYSLSLVNGGVLIFAENVSDAVTNATANFSLYNTDVKASIITTYAYLLGEFVIGVILLYNGAEVPLGTFDEFFAIPVEQSDYRLRTFYDFIINSIKSGDPGIGDPFVVGQHVIPIVHYTVPILKKMASEVEATSLMLSAMFPNATLTVTCSAEPFVAPFAHSSGGAYPHSSVREVTPASPFIALHEMNIPYNNARASLVIAVKQLSYNIQAVAVEEGQSEWDDLLYPNYAIYDTPLALMYGENLLYLGKLAKKYDPNGIMQLTGGFRFGL